MSIDKPQIFFSPRRCRFVGHRTLPQFVRGRTGLYDVHLVGLWWLCVAWLTPARKKPVL